MGPPVHSAVPSFASAREEVIAIPTSISPFWIMVRLAVEPPVSSEVITK